MAKTADLHIRVTPEIKADAEGLFSLLGITVTDAVTMFLHQALLSDGLPFEVKLPRYNAETEAAMQEARDIESGKIKAKAYSSFDEFLADLENDDDA
jgi:DNA-damage-inducible protein J